VLVQDNPWWAVYTHECPHCHALQVPRIDINAPTNAVSLDPNVTALYTEGGDINCEESVNLSDLFTSDDDSCSDMSGSDYDTDSDGSAYNRMLEDPPESENAPIDPPSDVAPISLTADSGSVPAHSNSDVPSGEDGAQYIDSATLGPSGAPTGPSSDVTTSGAAGIASPDQEDQAKLLILLCHTMACTGMHLNSAHEEICQNTKYLIQHVRSCHRSAPSGPEQEHAQGQCNYPWCSVCQRVLRHLARCCHPTSCAMCNPW
jgi:hypothetical protein